MRQPITPVIASLVLGVNSWILVGGEPLLRSLAAAIVLGVALPIVLTARAWAPVTIQRGIKEERLPVETTASAVGLLVGVPALITAYFVWSFGPRAVWAVVVVALSIYIVGFATSLSNPGRKRF